MDYLKLIWKFMRWALNAITGISLLILIFVAGIWTCAQSKIGWDRLHGMPPNAYPGNLIWNLSKKDDLFFSRNKYPFSAFETGIVWGDNNVRSFSLHLKSTTIEFGIRTALPISHHDPDENPIWWDSIDRYKWEDGGIGVHSYDEGRVLVEGFDSDDHVWWCWAPIQWVILASSFLPISRLAVAGWSWGILRNRKHNWQCSACGYDLRASPDRCPECGTPVPKSLLPKPST